MKPKKSIGKTILKIVIGVVLVVATVVLTAGITSMNHTKDADILLQLSTAYDVYNKNDEDYGKKLDQEPMDTVESMQATDAILAEYTEKLSESVQTIESIPVPDDNRVAALRVRMLNHFLILEEQSVQFREIISYFSEVLVLMDEMNAVKENTALLDSFQQHLDVFAARKPLDVFKTPHEYFVNSANLYMQSIRDYLVGNSRNDGIIIVSSYQLALAYEYDATAALNEMLNCFVSVTDRMSASSSGTLAGINTIIVQMNELLEIYFPS